jgi:hypothetical protein
MRDRQIQGFHAPDAIGKIEGEIGFECGCKICRGVYDCPVELSNGILGFLHRVRQFIKLGIQAYADIASQLCKPLLIFMPKRF